MLLKTTAFRRTQGGRMGKQECRPAALQALEQEHSNLHSGTRTTVASTHVTQHATANMPCLQAHEALSDPTSRPASVHPAAHANAPAPARARTHTHTHTHTERHTHRERERERERHTHTHTHTNTTDTHTHTHFSFRHARDNVQPNHPLPPPPTSPTSYDVRSLV